MNLSATTQPTSTMEHSEDYDGNGTTLHLPTSTKPDTSWYWGARVSVDSPGINAHVVYPDLSSMYPNLLRTLNISPDTIIGTAEDLRESEYDESDCVWAYIDPRPVKRCELDESWQDFTDGQYKAVQRKKDGSWKTPDGGKCGPPQYEKCYFLRPDIKQGFITELIDEFMVLKNKHDGTHLYDSTKAVINCFTPDTEVMTPTGVYDITELDVGDIVYSIDPDTMKVERKPVTETHEYPDYDGDIIDIETQKIDFNVTSNHRMLARSKHPSYGVGEYEFIEAGEMNQYTNYELPHDWEQISGTELGEVDITYFIEDEYEVFVSPNVHGHTFAHELGYYPDIRESSYDGRNGYMIQGEKYEKHREYIESVCDDEEMEVHADRGKKWVPKMYDGDDLLSLIAWYITEGSTYTSSEKEFNGHIRTPSTTVNIAQDEGIHHDTIGELLDSLGLDYYSDSSGYQFTSLLWARLLERMCGGDSFSKIIPDLVFTTSVEQKERFFHTLIDGDGDEDESSHRYTTSSDDLRDDFMRLCTHIGKNFSYVKDSGSWRVYYGDSKNTLRMHRSSETRESDNGVYCVTVADNHTLLAGRNGKFQWVGQSLYGVLGYATEHNAFRLFDHRLAEAVTLAGRKVLQETIDGVIEYSEQEYNTEAYTTHCDTDGAGIALDVSSQSAALEIAQNATDYLRDTGYGTFLKEQCGYSDDLLDYHSLSADVEYYAPRIYNHDKKKRYATNVAWDEGDDVDDIEITGFEAIRSDTANITVDVQTEVFDLILRNELHDVKDDVYEYISDTITTVENGEVPIEDLGVRGGIGQPLDEYGTANRTPQPIYRASRWSNQNVSEENISKASKPYYWPITDVVADDCPKRYDSHTAEDGTVVDYVAAEDPSNVDDLVAFDYETIAQKQVIDRVKPIIDNIDEYSWTELQEGHVSSSLDQFM